MHKNCILARPSNCDVLQTVVILRDTQVSNGWESKPIKQFGKLPVLQLPIDYSLKALKAPPLSKTTISDSSALPVPSGRNFSNGKSIKFSAEKKALLLVTSPCLLVLYLGSSVSPD